MPRKLTQKVKMLVPAMKEKDMDDQKIEASLAKQKKASNDFQKVHEKTKDKKEAIAVEKRKEE